MNRYEKIKSMTLYQMSRFLLDKVFIPYEIAVEPRRSQIKYVKQWLLKELNNNLSSLEDY